MKRIRITLLAAVILSFLIGLVACEQENDVLSEDYSTKVQLEIDNPTSISNGMIKDRLDRYALEAYANLYEVELSPKHTKLITASALQEWVRANEINKHPEINLANRKALANMENPVALLIQAPVGSPFKQSVLVVGAVSAYIITNELQVAYAHEIRLLQMVERGTGYYGKGHLDLKDEIPCICVKEYIIIQYGKPYSQCGRCTDPDNFPAPLVRNF